MTRLGSNLLHPGSVEYSLALGRDAATVQGPATVSNPQALDPSAAPKARGHCDVPAAATGQIGPNGGGQSDRRPVPDLLQAAAH